MGTIPESKAHCADWRIEEGLRREQQLLRAHELEAEGVSPAAVAAQIGESIATLRRWEAAYSANRDWHALIPGISTGRKSELQKIAEQLGVTVEYLDENILVKARGLNLDLESDVAALRRFARSDDCPEPLAELILKRRRSKHSVPPSLRKAVKINPNVDKAHRGPRQLSLGGTWTPRKMDVLPGDVFSADDTTPIWAWWVPWVECEEYPFGVKLLQGQLLTTIDVASQCVLTFALIAREKSSYRAADIWRLFGHTFDTVGLPRLGWQLERGSWEANIIRGTEVEYQDGEATLTRRLGGLRELPTNLTSWHKTQTDKPWPTQQQTWTSYLPKSKSIEGFFNRAQTFEGTLWGCLGRDQMRAPFEKARAMFQRCQRGAEDPRLHFLSQLEITRRVRELYEYVNSEPMEGEVFFGAPRQRFEQARSEYPLMPLPESERWLYQRDRRELKIKGGWARVRLTREIEGKRYSIHYGNPKVFAEIEGARVIVYYDREHSSEPAQIMAAETVFVGGKRFKPGEFICTAEFFERVGAFMDDDERGHQQRRAWREAVLASYATIVPHAPSRQVPPEIEARRRQAEAVRKLEREYPPEPEPIRRDMQPDRVQPPIYPTEGERRKWRERMGREAECANWLRREAENVRRDLGEVV
jgi:hypothetical protein